MGIITTSEPTTKTVNVSIDFNKEEIIITKSDKQLYIRNVTKGTEYYEKVTMDELCAIARIYLQKFDTIR